MTPVLSRAQIRAFDAYAIDALEVPGLVLMENAGRGASEVAARMVSEAAGGRVVVVAGTGNNGGDGLVVARHLAARGIDVAVVVVGAVSSVRGDALAQLEMGRAMGISMEVLDRTSADDAFATTLISRLNSAAVVVDALFGTGLDRVVEGHARRAIEATNACAARVLALDLPSGLDADRGEILGACVQADETVTFGAWKLGLLTPTGARVAGRRSLVGLGVSGAHVVEAPSVGSSATIVDPSHVGERLGARAVDAHKYSSGLALVVAGSAGKHGAAMLAARGALRAGAGLVMLATRGLDAGALLGALPEAMTLALESNDGDAGYRAAIARASSVVVGPGLGLDDEAARILSLAIEEAPMALVVDADALTLIATGRASLKGRGARPTILTPHAGELGRLLKLSSAEVERDRFASVRRAAKETGAIVLLKGPHTLVASPDGRVAINVTGTPALAAAGTGDVLAGAIGAIACRLDAFEAACAGVALHGLAGERAAAGRDRGVLASEVADALPAAIAIVRGLRPATEWLTVVDR